VFHISNRPPSNGGKAGLVPTKRIRKLDRISHHFSVAASNLQQSAAFGCIGAFDVAKVRASRPSGPKHHISLHPSGHAKNAGEICGPNLIEAAVMHSMPV
jgi:hypothetical protein